MEEGRLSVRLTVLHCETSAKPLQKTKKHPKVLFCSKAVKPQLMRRFAIRPSMPRPASIMA